MFPPCLPGEVWTLVFRLLSLSDRLRVRATCKYFRDLVDNALWRNWTVELRRSGDKYEEGYWRMLRRWRVTSARLLSDHSWTRISNRLPGLTTLTIDTMDFTDEQNLRGFTNLERLYLPYLSSSIDFEKFSLFMPQWLTHLTVCHGMWDSNTLPTQIPPDSPFKNLKSLAFHCKSSRHPVNVLHFFLSSLPRLQHLSLRVDSGISLKGHISDLPPLHNCSLSSLELLGCKTTHFPMDFMKMFTPLPFLRKLAIVCICGVDDNDESQKLSAWLRDLPALTSLVLQYTHLTGFVASIPSSVTCLFLLPFNIKAEDMTALSVQLPNLRHLRLEVEDHRLGPVTPLIPRLFPRLKSLCLYHEHVSEDVFLSLASLKELEVLETMDKDPVPAALVSKLRALTNNRVRIYRRPKEWLRSCMCVSSINYWP